jgi:5-oxoprolinase (ATP-hydrolysing)
MADLKAQIAANETGRRELLRMVDSYGAAGSHGLYAACAGQCEQSVRAVIADLKDGSFVYPMDTGQQIKVSVKIDHASGRACVDFTGTSAQHPGNYNAPFAVSRAVVLYVFV